MAFQGNFQALDTDLIIATAPRSGTLWLKSLAFATVNRTCYGTYSKQNHHHPLLTTSAHDLVPFLEYKQHYGANCLPPDDFTNSLSSLLPGFYLHMSLTLLCLNPSRTLP
ncbi:Sulfotransferase domain [Macleaya cordata]|uniref:Sulfotransferase n=1 Tax=Macleaya cordata TaxID=56857 RepID=A0A200PMT5_MACCD|nr:Sulfotransferase domain [Macleaya cordata]